MAAGQASIDGNAAALGQLMAMLDSFKPLFEIVTPLGSEAPGDRMDPRQVYTAGNAKTRQKRENRGA